MRDLAIMEVGDPSAGAETCTRCGKPQVGPICIIVFGDSGPLGPPVFFCDTCFDVKVESFVEVNRIRRSGRKLKDLT